MQTRVEVASDMDAGGAGGWDVTLTGTESRRVAGKVFFGFRVSGENHFKANAEQRESRSAGSCFLRHRDSREGVVAYKLCAELEIARLGLVRYVDRTFTGSTSYLVAWAAYAIAPKQHLHWQTTLVDVMGMGQKCLRSLLA